MLVIKLYFIPGRVNPVHDVMLFSGKALQKAYSQSLRINQSLVDLASYPRDSQCCDGYVSPSHLRVFLWAAEVEAVVSTPVMICLIITHLNFGLITVIAPNSIDQTHERQVVKTGLWKSRPKGY